MKKTVIRFAMAGMGLVLVACGSDPKAGQLLGSITQSSQGVNVCIEFRVDGDVSSSQLSQAKSSLQSAQGFSTGVCAIANVKGECAFSKSQGGVTANVIMYADDAAQLQQACSQVGGSFSSR